MGRRIRVLRGTKGLSQDELAASSGLHRSHVGQVERGETNVTLGTLQRVGIALGVSVSVLVRGVGEDSGGESGQVRSH